MPTLLTLTLSGSALALLLLALRYLILRRMPSTVYYYAWLLVLLRFALPLPGLIPTAPEAEAPEAAVYGEAEADSENAASDLILPRPAPDIFAAVPAPESAFAPAEAETAAEREARAPAKAAPAVDWRSPALRLTVWALGAALSLGGTVLAYLRFTLRLRREAHRPDRFTCALYAAIPGPKPALACSAAIQTPVMFGVFSPKIVLPARPYDEALLGNILRHELMHYRRRDTLYKWLAAAVLSAHWFNPLSWLIRRELNRACELSCDEMLLRSMSRGEKQSYGDTLLSMAASAALPAGVVATTFATEKRNLKERLVQIMQYKKKSRARLLAAVLACALLVLCGLAVGPYTQQAEAETAIPPDAVRVSSVDELLAALAPHTTLYLEPGVYDLSAAANYGGDSHSTYYSWEQVWSTGNEMAAELVIHQLEGLTILGAGRDKTTLAAVPRYANVLRFVGCKDLTVSALTAGHTTEYGFCRGGVVRLENCRNVRVSDCGLFGCGTIGVDAQETNSLTVSCCDIYECSYNAVSLRQCRDVLVDGCEVHDHGLREGQGAALALFTAAYSDKVVFHQNRVHDNAAQYLLQLSYTKNAAFLTNEVRSNRFDTGVFSFEQYGATVDGCAFADNSFHDNWVQSGGVYANDVSGKLLDAADFEAMTLRDIDPDAAVTPAPVSATATVRPGGEIVVKTVDEFLSALGSDRNIVLDGALFDLSTAVNYGSVGGEYYYWSQSYDGPELVIQDVKGLTIRAASDDPKAVTLAAIPRYANVLNFRNCEDIVLLGFTAGHTKEPGACSGGVLNLWGCRNVTIERMRLYGCGILGIQAAQCATLNVRGTEIYECSQGAGQFFQTDGLVFADCDVHDVPSPAFRFNECGDKSWNGEPFGVLDSKFDVDENGALVVYELPRDEVREYTGSIEDLVNPFAEEEPFTYEADAPQAQFAALVQRDIAEGDWESLAEKLAFPLQFFVEDYSAVIHDRADFMDSVANENFLRNTFNEAFRERIAQADPTVFGHTLFGQTCLDHSVAIACFGAAPSVESMKINAISVAAPLWPGRSMYDKIVPPTPQP